MAKLSDPAYGPYTGAPADSDTVTMLVSGRNKQVPVPNLIRQPFVTVGPAGSFSNYVCDGVADDVQINAAIAAVGIAGGGTVFIRRGTYALANIVQCLYSNVHIVGESWATILRLDNGVNKDVVAFGDGGTTTGLSGFRISNLKVDGNKANQTTTSHGIRLWADFFSATDAIVENCWVTDAKNGNISNDSCTYSKVISCTLTNAGTHGIYSESVSRCTYTANTIKSCVGSGIQYNSGSYCASTGNVIYGCNIGVEWQGPSNTCTATNNVIRESTTFGIYINDGYGNIVTGNVIKLSGQDGIRVRHSSYNTLIGNTLTDNGQATDNTYADIFLTDVSSTYSTYNTVIGNTCSATATNKVKYSIRENNSSNDYNSATGNTCTGAVTAGISLLGAHSVRHDTGASLVPRATTTEKNALAATNGMILYDTTLNKFQGYENSAWVNLV